MPTLVETLPTGTGNAQRENPFNGPVDETEKARFEQMGPFLAANAPANQAATAMLLAGSADHSKMVMARAGTIVGICVLANTAVTANSTTFNATKAGTAVGDAAKLQAAGAGGPTTQVIQNFVTPVAFAKGDLLSITQATAAGYTPTTADYQAWLLIKWTPADDV